MGYVDRRPKIKIIFTKQNGRSEGSVLEPVPEDWNTLSDIRKRAWAQHVAERVHSGATFLRYEMK